MAPVRIDALTLCDFRAFPGPDPYTFKLDGKNLLVYGENGSGKSSIFHALKEFFSFSPKTAAECKNIFSASPLTDYKVEVLFQDGARASWDSTVHPTAVTATGPAKARVTEAALRRGCLDYRALLDTNYKHGNDEINLFDVAVDHLMRDFEVTVGGGTPEKIGKLWSEVLRLKPLNHFKVNLDRSRVACEKFDGALQDALTRLTPPANEILGLLSPMTGTTDLEIAFPTPPTINYDERLRQYAPGKISIEVKYRGRVIPKPQGFLNEARLSAVGLAIYLGGLLAYTPPGGDALKLLVLDDVLVGLDHSNRFPVLDVLRQKFADWQIVLITYDKIWAEMVRHENPAWAYYELYDGTYLNKPVPVAENADLGQAFLDRAASYLDPTKRDERAAAMHARAAFETIVKNYCDKKSVKVPYKKNPKEIKVDAMWTGVTERLAGNIAFQTQVQAINQCRSIVLNALSHATAAPLTSVEVQRAIQAVAGLKAALATL